MKRLRLLLFLFVVSAVHAATSVTQFGITWTFNGDYPVGQYVNGDYYVIAPSNLTITSIYPPSVVGNGVPNQAGNGDTYPSGRTVNGSQINPSSGASHPQGMDSYCEPTFSSALNVGRPGGNTLNSGNPLVVPPGSSLCSSRSDSASYGGNRPQLLDEAILTVVASAPPANSFRPPYCGSTKALWNESDLNYSVLQNFAPVASQPSWASCEASVARPWIETETSYQGRDMHPQNNQDTYGREIAATLGTNGLVLHTSATNATKRLLFIRMVQIGIDIYGAALNGANWYSAGGHNMGRKYPLVLAAIALNDAGMKAYADKTQHNIFADDQHYFVVGTGDQTQYIGHGDFEDKYRTDYTPRTATVAISNSTPAVITWPTTATTVTISNSSPATIGWTAHGLYVGQLVQFSSTGSLPTGISAGVDYFVQPDGLTSNSFRVSLYQNVTYQNSRNSTAYPMINTSSAGSGTFSCITGHGLGVTQQIVFTSTGGLPSPLVANVKYWILAAGRTTATFRISATPGNENDYPSYNGTTGDKAAINTTTSGSGTHTATFNMFGQVDWGEQHSVDNTRDGSNWNSAYRTIVDNGVFPAVLSARMLTGGKALWNWQPVFDYMDGAYTSGYTAFQNNMYAAYRAGLDGPDTTPPTLTGIAVSPTGNSIAFTFSEAVSSGTGFTITASGGPVALTYGAGTGTNTLTYNTSRTIMQPETLARAYAPGTIADLATSPNALASISSASFANGSTAGSGGGPTSLPMARIRRGVF